MVNANENRYHTRIHAAYRQHQRRYGKRRAGTLTGFVARVASKQARLQPYLNQQYATIAVRLNPRQCRAATYLRVNTKDANAYEHLCTQIGAEALVVAGGSATGARALESVPVGQWVGLRDIRARYATDMGPVRVGDSRPVTAPAAVHPQRARQLSRAYDELAARVSRIVGAAVANLTGINDLKVFARNNGAIKTAIEREMGSGHIDSSAAQRLAHEAQIALARHRGALARLKNLRQRAARIAAADRHKQQQQQQHQSVVSREVDAWSDEEETAELVSLEADVRAGEMALQEARLAPLTDQERLDVAHEADTVAQAVQEHLCSVSCTSLRAALVSEAELASTPIGCATCGGRKMKKVMRYDAPAKTEEKEEEEEEEKEDDQMEAVDDEGDDEDEEDDDMPPLESEYMTAACSSYDDDVDAAEMPPLVAATAGSASYDNNNNNNNNNNNDADTEIYDDDDDDADMPPLMAAAEASVVYEYDDYDDAEMPPLQEDPATSSVYEYDDDAAAEMPPLETDPAAYTVYEYDDDAEMPPVEAMEFVTPDTDVIEAAMPVLVEIEVAPVVAGSAAAVSAPVTVPADSPADAPAVRAVGSRSAFEDHILDYEAHYKLYREACNAEVGGVLTASTVYLQPTEDFSDYQLTGVQRGGSTALTAPAAALVAAPPSSTVVSERVQTDAHPGVVFALLAPVNVD